MHVIIFDAYVVHDRYEYDTQNTLKCSYTHKPGAGVSSINMHGPRPCYLAPGAMQARTLVSPYRQRRRLCFLEKGDDGYHSCFRSSCCKKVQLLNKVNWKETWWYTCWVARSVVVHNKVDHSHACLQVASIWRRGWPEWWDAGRINSPWDRHNNKNTSFQKNNKNTWKSYDIYDEKLNSTTHQ